MILLFAGTSDSRELAIQLKRHGMNLLVSVVTEEAAELITAAGLTVMVGRLTTEAMGELIADQNIQQIVDASAPYAEIVSKNAIAAAAATGIPYCRYERPLVVTDSPHVLQVPDYQQAARAAADLGGRLLLTTGIKTLALFAQTLLPQANVELFVRFIPRVGNMRLAKNLGIKKQNILAMQGPFSASFETALYQNYSISTVISKEGGRAGSLPSKIQAVDHLGIQMVLIERPSIHYPHCFHKMHLLMEHVVGLSQVNVPPQASSRPTTLSSQKTAARSSSTKVIPS